MKIIVNHLTRMQPGYFCVAGLELQSRLHIRPVLETQLPVELLWRYGGPFELSTVLDLGKTRFVGRVPEIEDQLFDREQVVVVDRLTPQDFWQANVDAARESLADVFGVPMPVVGATCALPEHQGLYSLGCYWAMGGRLVVLPNPDGMRLRFHFQHDGRELRVPVTDIRMYREDHRTVNSEVAGAYAAKLEGRDRVLVSIGLSRPFRKSESQDAMHWLQVNNIHLPKSTSASILAS